MPLLQYSLHLARRAHLSDKVLLHDHTAASKHDYSSNYCRDLSICPSDSEQKQSMSLAHDEQGLARTQRPGRRSSSLEEIIVEVIDDKVELIIHWQGGDH